MAHADHSSSTSHTTGVLPEPGDAADYTPSSGRADDLISQLADKQIDDMLGDDAEPAPADADAALELAHQAAAELSALAAPLREATSREIGQDIAPTVSSTHATTAQAAEPATATDAGGGLALAGDFTTSVETAATAPTAEAQTPSVASTESPESVVTESISAEPVSSEAQSEAALALESVPAAAATVESTPIEPSTAAPSFDPPRPATIESTHASETITPASSAASASLALIEPPAAAGPTPLAIAPDPTSSADAVARELEADVALLSQPLPAPTPDTVDATPAAATWWQRALHAILGVPMMLLSIVNLPVQPLSDRGREIMGASALVTLVNAIGLLAYLRFFAHRH